MSIIIDTIHRFASPFLAVFQSGPVFLERRRFSERRAPAWLGSKWLTVELYRRPALRSQWSLFALSRVGDRRSGEVAEAPHVSPLRLEFDGALSYVLGVGMSLKNLFPIRIAAGWAGVLCWSFLSQVQAASPSIVITNLPAFGTFGNLGGYVTNANTTTNCVAAFIFVGGGWYSKPYCNPQFTPIQTNGSWSANITTANSDTNATEIAAFLVPTNYNQLCVNGAPGLTNTAQVEAMAYAVRVNPATRQFNFSGYRWWVKTSSGLEGPGPNYFSDSTNNVWVDGQGWLHLKITYTNNQWQCVEVISDRSFGYGQYRFTVNTPVSVLGTNVVLGLFTWSDDAAYNDREIDMEQSRWEYAYGPSDMEDYAISPYQSGQQTNFGFAASLTNSTHSFIWQSNNVAFQSLIGGFASPPASSNLLATWSCALGIPPAGGEQVHINLWLEHGSPPTNNQPVEVILSQFEFVPLGSPQPAHLGSLSGLPSDALLSVLGATDWHYQMLASSNLLDWLAIGSFIATNNAFQFTDTNPVASRARFYRVLTEP